MTTTLCVVGAGPRGISVVERICANAAVSGSSARVVVHLVDPLAGEGGRVWRVDQPQRLLMNTVASQVTMYTDESVECAGPIVPGPSLYDWAKRPGFGAAYPAHVRAEAGELTPNSYPTRAFYGYYLRWVLRRLIRSAPAHIRVELHRATAVALHDVAGGSQVLELDDGRLLSGLDAVVLAQGHVDMVPTEEERRLAEYSAAGDGKVSYQPPSNPADVDLGFIGAGEPVMLRGMGLNFFDYLELLTTGRGGRFVRREDGGLTYRPSGCEPLMYAGSRRSVPYHARGENEKGPTGRHEPRVLTQDVIDSLRARGGTEFQRDVWSLIAREVGAVYYRTLISERRGAAEAEAFVGRYLADDVIAEKWLPGRHGVRPSELWDWARIARPYGERSFGDHAEFQSWLLDYLRADLVEARRGNVTSPVKAALDVLRDLRNEIRLVVDHSGLTGRSYRDELREWYTPFNAFVSIGPPAQRIEEMIALMQAGLLQVFGPGVRVEPAPDGDAFLVSSVAIPGPPVRVSALVEARLPEMDIRRTNDPLIKCLLRTGQCRPYLIPDQPGEHYETGGLAVTRRPYHLVDADERPHPRRFAFGVPTESVHWVTAAGIRPGVNSVILADSDAIARACLFPAEDLDLVLDVAAELDRPKAGEAAR
ncbi:FAD/NAD(P)-binding protein [Amycolatopsis nigrescens]|uniref:FAD/NAD(P)-binding protein n=1 Tax=Amycolatopsis nigrescens TaxID=381445 RepID=UPI00036D4FEF|nr:FAD/NAD(P)-binding protein [Amycolatopsis nigrescens]